MTLDSLTRLRVRSVLGYGTYGSGFYRDPLSNPVSFLRTAPRRLVTLLADAWVTPDFDEWGPKAAPWVLALVAVSAVLLLFLPVRRAIARLDPARRATATWLLLGSIFSLAPVLAVAPSARLIGVSMLGVAAVVAVVLDHAWFPVAAQSSTPPRRGLAELTGIVALSLGFAHLVHDPVLAWISSNTIHSSAREFASRVSWMRARIADPKNANVVVIRATWQATLFTPFALDPVHGTPPARWRVLAQTQGHVLVLRKDARTIEIVNPRGKSMFPWGTDDLFRIDDAPLRVGEQVSVPGMRATILESDANGTYRVSFEFDRDLEDAPLEWFIENADNVQEVPLPKPGFGAPLDP